MRKKLGTRFPASRIKKIMQADEDVGKIALAVPILVSKALELFLQDLCDRTYEVTLQRGAKTLNSLHLKQCVKMYSAFDFLTDVVNKVPNLGGTESFRDEKGISRRRKNVVQDGDQETDDSRSAKLAMLSTNTSPGARGRGRGRGRGRPPLNRMLERESSSMKYEDEIELSPEHGNTAVIDADHTAERLKEGGGHTTNSSIQQPKSSESVADTAEYSAWPSANMVGGSLGFEPSNLVTLNMNIDEEEDYDNED
ncbi:hypothetical protein KSP40_PGU018640 [Platanthera guangdongensis]|uniref:Transcription factor CBF/NF-Y/archaeal histone domain-containing protein n=1 Tax=Platanthera guangdongensis TaxID=2320717 RepID=A0ABR2LIC5_9ASPA